MKSSLFSRIIIASLALLLAGSAFAANAHKDTFQVSAPVRVGSTQLPAGEYEARWEGSGPTVQLNIIKGKKVLATVPAQVVDLGQTTRDTEAEIKNGSTGAGELTVLRFSGKKYALELNSESAKAQTKSDSTN